MSIAIHIKCIFVHFLNPSTHAWVLATHDCSTSIALTRLLWYILSQVFQGILWSKQWALPHLACQLSWSQESPHVWRPVILSDDQWHLLLFAYLIIFSWTISARHSNISFWMVLMVYLALQWAFTSPRRRFSEILRLQHTVLVIHIILVVIKLSGIYKPLFSYHFIINQFCKQDYLSLIWCPDVRIHFSFSAHSLSSLPKRDFFLNPADETTVRE